MTVEPQESRPIAERERPAPPASRSKHPTLLRGVRPARNGARFDPLLAFDDWLHFGAKLGAYSNATCWWFGDWIAFGQMKYGRRYKAAIAVTGLDYQTLRNYAVVARRFDMSRRRDNLTFQHHAELCALPDDEQERWLDRAAAGHWTRNELRRRLRGIAEKTSTPSVTLRLAVEEDQAASWRAAAARSASSFEAWATRVLDEAAAESPGS
jgi:hypothetical protein